MKKTTLLSVFVAFTFACSAQYQFGIFAGPQTTTAKYTIAGVKQPNQYKYGFNAGIAWKVPFEGNLFFSPAAFYSLKGYKVEFNHYSYPPDTLANNNNTTIHTFELAFMLQYDFSKQPDHFFIKAGPSMDFQLKGKEKYSLKAGSSVEQNMVYSFEEYGRYAGSLLMQFGFETGSGFMIFGQYTHGLVNLNNADEGPKIKHRVYGISVGKLFNNKTRKIVLNTKNRE